MKQMPRYDDRKAMTQMSDTLDALAEFEEFRNSVLPAIRKDLSAGMTVDELRKKYAALCQARLITLAATSPNEAAAIAASKDLLDRHEGKAKERKEVSHRLGKLPENELDALVLSLEEEAESE